MEFRTKKNQAKYNAYRASKQKKSTCDFCVHTPDKEKHFTFWKVIPNIFPYDKITEQHDMIVPKRHFKFENEMTPEEREELVYLKRYVLPRGKKYDFIWENFIHMRSVEHYHIHLLRFKR